MMGFESDKVELGNALFWKSIITINHVGRRLSPKYTSRLPLNGQSLMRLTDWVPSAAVRKRQKKLIADEIAEINEFRAEGRMGLARWRRVWLALYWLCYLLGAPIAAVVRIAKKTSAG